MMSLSGGSKVRASARITSVTMFTHRICTGVIGSSPPSAIATTITPASPPLVGSMKAIAFFRLS
jgi:hypothetical protein